MRLAGEAGPPRRGALFRGSLRKRLVAVVVTLDVFATILNGTVIVFTARSATKVEIRASMRLADVLVGDTIRLMQDVPASLILETIELHVQNIRRRRRMP